MEDNKYMLNLWVIIMEIKIYPLLKIMELI